MILISKTLSDLQGEIVDVCTHSIEGDYPTEYQTYEEAWENLLQSFAYLRRALGERRFGQLVDMTAQARRHFEDGEIKLGARLMQDMEQVVRDKPPFAYPVNLYRW